MQPPGYISLYVQIYYRASKVLWSWAQLKVWNVNLVYTVTYCWSEVGLKVSSVVGMKLDSVEAVTERRMRGKLQAIMDNPFHPLYARAEATQEHVQPQTHPTICLKALGGPIILSAIRLHNTPATAPNTSPFHWLRTQPYTALSL